jgi:hypothetical protein
MDTLRLDDYFATRRSPIDAMKLDVQGSELSVLKGAKKTLAEDQPFLFIESWSYPVYDHAPLLHELLTFMSVEGYFIFDTDTAASWYYKNSLDGYGRARQIGLNLLLVPNLELALERWSKEKVRHFAFIFDLWGYSNASLYLAETSGDTELSNALRRLGARWPHFLRRFHRVQSRVVNRNLHRLT